MADSHHVDKPEPRWQALLAFLVVGGIYLALPRSLIIGPTWLLPTLILVLLVPTMVSHRLGRRSLNRVLGVLISSVTTVALIGSVILLVRALPSHKEDPLSLLLSGAELWLTNVLVFALWVLAARWRWANPKTGTARIWEPQLLFPQMQIEKSERGRFECEGWRPRFVDYLSWRSRKVPRLVRRTRPYSRAGQKCLPWCRSSFR